MTCTYTGPLTGLPCANEAPEPHAHYTAAADCPQAHDTEARQEDQR